MCQVSDKIDPAELVAMIAGFNPDNIPGRLAVIVRMGAAKLRTHLPALIEAVEAAGQVGTLACISDGQMICATHRTRGSGDGSSSGGSSRWLLGSSNVLTMLCT